MMTFLDTIVKDKREELKNFPPQIEIHKQRKTQSFKEKLDCNSNIQVIAEVKRASPSKGDMNLKMDPVDQAKKYAQGGADAISVLTDTSHFKGSMEDLESIRQHTDLPILNKDFIIDERQIFRAYNAGADIILLIVAILNLEQLKRFYQIATDLGLDVIVEIHDINEMETALELNPTIIGINNRNLHHFTVDLNHTKRVLSKYNRDDIHFIAESGIHSLEDANQMKKAGASGLLIGEALVLADDPSQFVKELKGGGRDDNLS